MSWRNLLHELRRRRVYRVSAAYVIAAFALLQGADVVLPALGAAPWVMTVLVIAAIAGLPVAAALAWIFDITPDGIRRTVTQPHADGSPGTRVSRRTAVLGVAGVAAIFLLAGTVAWLAVRSVLAEPGAAPLVADAAAGPNPATEASVAVLPCIDVSAGRDHEYFGDGITEEIIGELAHFEGLKVISRTSVVAMRGTGLTLPQIADTLGVNHVLQCSIQRSGGNVRVRAQLIDPHTDAHLWSEVYDREMADVVSMQEDIARQVGSALLTRLPAVRPQLASRVLVPQAYDAYLRGTAARRQGSPPALRSAIAAFEESIAADPRYSPAYSGLSHVHAVWALFGYTGAPEPYDRVPVALDFAERAIALDSSSADAWAARGHAGLRAWLPGERVLADFNRAVQIAPSSGEFRLLRAIGLAYAGRFEEAMRETEAAVLLDPLAVGHHDFRAVSLLLGRRYDDALQSARVARSIAPDFVHARRQEARALLLLGRFDECARLDPGPYRALHAMCMHSLGREAEAREVIRLLGADAARTAPDATVHNGVIATDIAEYYAWIGDVESTLNWVRRAIEYSPAAPFLVDQTATYDRVRDKAAFQAGFERIRADVRSRIASRTGLATVRRPPGTGAVRALPHGP